MEPLTKSDPKCREYPIKKPLEPKLLVTNNKFSDNLNSPVIREISNRLHSPLKLERILWQPTSLHSDKEKLLKWIFREDQNNKLCSPQFLKKVDRLLDLLYLLNQIRPLLLSSQEAHPDRQLMPNSLLKMEIKQFWPTILREDGIKRLDLTSTFNRRLLCSLLFLVIRVLLWDLISRLVVSITSLTKVWESLKSEQGFK